VSDIAVTVANIISQNVPVHEYERVLVLTDNTTAPVAEEFIAGLRAHGVEPSVHQMIDLSKSGEEPPKEAVEAIRSADLVFAMTKHSLTHTSARKQANAQGIAFVTMPGITSTMLTEGAMTADYARVEAETLAMTARLTAASLVRIRTGLDRVLEVPVAERHGIASTGVYRTRGTSGNLPSGEAYIAPDEGKASGLLEVNGSIAGLGLVTEPVLLTIEEGRLVDATGDTGNKLLDLLGDGPGRNVAELGIGTNHAARVIGNILEDEKAYKTIHIAFGSNDTFGGTVAAGVHIDCIVIEPRVEWEF
jgi:leucyl aminopeptidase (aminopeptidase T)